jgi:microcystin-dependent protein
MSAEFLGAVKVFAGNFAISGFAFCDGRLLSIAQNSALFALLGTTYGGNGTTTFALPDLRGRAPIGMGTGAGLTPRTIGSPGGSETVSLFGVNMPSHTHALNATTASTNNTTPGPGVLTGALNSSDGTFYTAPGQAGFTAVALNANALNQQGGNLPHNNIQPSLGINYIIALAGIFPSRN